MGGSGRKRDTGIYRSARPLVDEGVVPEYFHGANGADEAGSYGSGHLYRGCDRGVVVGGGNNNSPAAGEGGGQIIGGMPMLEEGDSPGREDQEDAEDDILDKAALGMGNLGRDHKRIRTNTALSSLQKWQGST